MNLSFIELWQATGPLARGVVVLLGGLSVGTGAVAADKWLRLRRAERATAAFFEAWRAAMPDADLAALAASHAASPAAALVRDVSRILDGAPTAAEGEILDRSARRHLLAVGTELRKGLGVLATVGATAPFIGLFGTVIGIINAFHEIGATGHGGISTVSTGIAEALVTTAFGILVAIPAVWLFNHLSQRIGRLLASTECAAEDVAIARLAGASPRRPSSTARAASERGGAAW
jgi:biopolymer transport protein ExbB/TolQ